jgi:hypothetical protein
MTIPPSAAVEATSAARAGWRPSGVHHRRPCARKKASVHSPLTTPTRSGTAVAACCSSMAMRTAAPGSSKVTRAVALTYGSSRPPWRALMRCSSR